MLGRCNIPTRHQPRAGKNRTEERKAARFLPMCVNHYTNARVGKIQEKQTCLPTTWRNVDKVSHLHGAPPSSLPLRQKPRRVMQIAFLSDCECFFRILESLWSSETSRECHFGFIIVRLTRLISAYYAAAGKRTKFQNEVLISESVIEKASCHRCDITCSSCLNRWYFNYQHNGHGGLRVR